MSMVKPLLKNGKLRYMNNFEIIMLKYPYNGKTKSGMIKLEFALNLEDDRFEFRRIEYSDDDIRSYVRKNPSILTKVQSIRNT